MDILVPKPRVRTENDAMDKVKKKRLDLTFATAAHSCTIVHTVIAKSML